MKNKTKKCISFQISGAFYLRNTIMMEKMGITEKKKIKTSAISNM